MRERRQILFRYLQTKLVLTTSTVCGNKLREQTTTKPGPSLPVTVNRPVQPVEENDIEVYQVAVEEEQPKPEEKPPSPVEPTITTPTPPPTQESILST